MVFGWGREVGGDLPPDASTATVTVEPAEGGSLVTLVHEGLTEVQAAMHAEGWNHYFERLERLAATGDAGQDEWARAPDTRLAHRGRRGPRGAPAGAAQPDRRGPSDRRPRADFTCHDVAEHLFGSLAHLGAMAGATVVNPDRGPWRTASP